MSDGLRLCLDCGDAYTTGDYCASCQHQRNIDMAESDPEFESYLDAFEYYECDITGHDWIEDYTGETVCQRCGVTYYEEEGP